MKEAICIWMLIVISSFSSGQVGIDSVPPKVKEIAKYKTDRQIDSVYRVVDIRPVVDALQNNFGALRVHMDSLNMVILMSQIELAKESELRDGAMIEMHRMSLENDRLRNENERKQQQIKIISQGTHILMGFASVMAIIFFGIGIRNYYVKDKYNG